MNGEELLCALQIDGHANVARWIRNIEYESQGGFSLPKSPGRFFPDYIVEMNNRQIVLVEYKDKDRAQSPDELHKKAVGELWAQRSEGECRFAWVAAKDWNALHRTLGTL